MDRTDDHRALEHLAKHAVGSVHSLQPPPNFITVTKQGSVVAEDSSVGSARTVVT